MRVSALLKSRPAGARYSIVSETFRARKAISKTMKSFMYRDFHVNRFYF